MDSKEVARRIHKRLENRKYLLILDGVVEFINLRELGIPDGNNCGKVVMASHIHQVLKWNNVDTLINVKPLSRHEAWKMFQDIVGHDIIGLPGIPPIARRVCERCSCLPLLIQKIASSFKWKTDARSWNAGLKALKPWPEHGIEGVEELYKCLKFCFEELKDEKKQKCFLYSSMYPADSKVYTDYLVECWAAQGFLGDVNDTCYQDVRDKGHEIVDDLVNVSLLEKGERKIYVRMHDCIRQLALHISSKSPDCHTYVMTSENSMQLDNSKVVKNSRWVSMIDNKLINLPDWLGSVMLSTLLLQKNAELAVIQQTFFENMTNLVLLDLYGTRIEELPPSLSTLIALKGLYLNDCMLLTLLPSEIASLQCLQVLDIRGSGVPFIPIPIKSLANLKCLRISYVTRADQYGDHVILELHKLEELIINVVSYQQWCEDAEHIMQQVASLKNLSTLRCSFPSASMLEEFLLRSKSWQDDKPFNSFRFFVGCQYSKCPQILESFDYRMNKYLKYCNGDRNDDFVNSRVLAHTEAFELICHKNIRNLSDFAGTTSLKDVRSFLIKGCNKMSSIVAGDIVGNGNRQENESILPNLQHLCMDNLLNLKHVFRGPLHSGTLSKLQVLVLKNCPSLKTIFFRVATTDFPKLQMLIIENCSEIEGLLMFKEVTERERNVLPKLEKLVLSNLPIFKSICTKETLAWPSLKLLEIYDCPALKSLPFGMDNAANLRSIKGQKEWWDNLEWTNNKAQEQLQIIFEAS
ncbi:hypothetical protein L6164_037312 [Bauhinia variegata]|uniref:Uncharacterized protein n=1 Tax=Bauhinia variegata TaxID=167791 RepID=A0ACB9KJS6_BAUVA|nr:hypothetical protein L6164_037312 [Bauhinia variegata]